MEGFLVGDTEDGSCVGVIEGGELGRIVGLGLGGEEGRIEG